MTCLCVEYSVQNQNDNKFFAVIFLGPEESKKFKASFNEDRRSPFRRISVTIENYEYSPTFAVVQKMTDVTGEAYMEFSPANDSAIIGQTNLYQYVCKELLQIRGCDLEEEENIIISQDDVPTSQTTVSSSEESSKSDVAFDSTIHDLVYASNFEELASVLSTGEFSATGKDEHGVQPIYLLDTKPEQFEKAVLILETLVNCGARIDQSGLGYDDEGQPKEIWLLIEALRNGNYNLANILVAMGHPLLNADPKNGYLFDVTEMWYNNSNDEMDM